MNGTTDLSPGHLGFPAKIRQVKVRLRPKSYSLIYDIHAFRIHNRLIELLNLAWRSHTR